jgi:hypothetical protein
VYLFSMGGIMAKGGKRKGSGRKPTGKVAMLVRMAPDVRARLERAAGLSGQSLSAAAEEHLNYALRSAAPLDKQTRALCFLIGSVTLFGRGLGEERAFNWRERRFDFEALKCAVMEVLDRLAPAGPVGDSPYPKEATPEAAGHTLASMAIGMLHAPDQLLAVGERQQKPMGSLYYAFPQAARDLGVTGENK